MVLDVFVSHSERDEDLVSLVKYSIEVLDLDAYVEMYEEYYGEDAIELIQEAIEGCEYFFAILTEESVKSPWVNQEIGYACALEKNIVPVRVGNVKVPGMIYGLKAIKSKPDDVEDLIDKIQRHLIELFDLREFLVQCEECGEEYLYDLPDDEDLFLMNRKGEPMVRVCGGCDHENEIDPNTLLHVSEE